MIRTVASAQPRRVARRKAGAGLLVAVALCVGFTVLGTVRAAPADATTLARVGIEEAARSASTVVIGTVVGTQVEQSPQGVRTAVRLWVGESLKGTASGIITAYVPGGDLPDGSRVIVDSMASFAPGEVCCVFVDTRGWVLGGYQGKLHLGESGLDSATAAQSAVVGRVRAALAGETPAETTTAPSHPAQVPLTSGLLASQPAIAWVSPLSMPAGTGGRVTITGRGFGATPGSVGFALNIYGVTHMASDQIVSWSDSQIVCEVPVGSVAGSFVSPGSGPIVVTTVDGAQSNPYEFRIPFGFGARKWPTPQASYLLNTGGVDAARRESLVDAGAATWNAARSAFAFVDAGLTGAGAAKDGSNVICWSDTIPVGVVALTLVYANAAGEVSECDLQFNAALNWGDGVAAGTSDTQTIALHELGHWLCLLDQYTDADMSKVMYGYELYGQHRELTVGEYSGIRWIYPGPSGTLSGMVRDTAGVPLAGATIAVDTCEPVASNPDGSFAVTGTPPGTYQVACSRPGYTSRIFSATIVVDQTTNTTVTLVPSEEMPIYRFFQRKNGSHFYTASSAERDSVVSKLSRTYTFEGTAYSVNRLDPANSAPLYRFFNKKNGSHFYTASEVERDSVRTKLSRTYKYEGAAYLISPAPTLATVPVYRFFNKRNRSHFYTTSIAEKNRVIRDLGETYAYEGTAFWVAP